MTHLSNLLGYRGAVKSVVPWAASPFQLDYTSGVGLAGPLHHVPACYEWAGDVLHGR